MTHAPRSTLVLDISNLLFRVAAVQLSSPLNKGASTDDLVGLCMHTSMLTMLKWYNKIKPDFVVFAFEGDQNWRKGYTNQHQVRRQYKANRVVDPAMKHFYLLIDRFKETMTNHTSVCCLSVPGTEADDAIGAYCQLYASPTHTITIVSGDRDFIQLTKLPNVRLINPDTGKLRNQPGDKDYEPDIDYWLFYKCVRGDGGDNVPSAFPKVRETKIREAYNNEYARINFMNTTWSNADEVTHRVGDLFAHNEVLMDLAKQPTEIREKLLTGVTEQVAAPGKYSHFHFLKFLNDFQLEKLRSNATQFADLLSANQRMAKRIEASIVTAQPPSTGGLLEY